DAQNTLLKIFEEPIKDTHFFIITPDTNALLRTFVSRFYLISNEQEQKEKTKPVSMQSGDAEKFLKMSLRERIDFLKEFLKGKDVDDEEIVIEDSVRSKALHFLSILEFSLHYYIFLEKKYNNIDLSFFNQIFKVREFLRQPGSSAKTLMESLALDIPTF
ncbi:MAG: hypothetical protein WA101_03525, partial [Minisyncoccia bacterium]